MSSSGEEKGDHPYVPDHSEILEGYGYVITPFQDNWLPSGRWCLESHWQKSFYFGKSLIVQSKEIAIQIAVDEMFEVLVKDTNIIARNEHNPEFHRDMELLMGDRYIHLKQGLEEMREEAVMMKGALDDL